MSEVINELAKITISDEMLLQLDVNGIYSRFGKNFKKLDDLKNFREGYDKKNWVMRFWHNDELRDAQLNSTEVQAEFSKTIGQLMLLSILQSQKLAAQQTQLNEQQAKLRRQADGIAEHASTLQMQHHSLAEQSGKLKTLVDDYFALKGLTEDGAQRLVEIAGEIRGTKDGMLREFELHTSGFESLCADITAQMATLAVQVKEQVRQGADQAQAGVFAIQREISAMLAGSAAAIKTEQAAAQQTVAAEIEKITHAQREFEARVLIKTLSTESVLANVLTALDDQTSGNAGKFGAVDGVLARLTAQADFALGAITSAKAELVACAQQQKSLHTALATARIESARRIKYLAYAAIVVAVVVLYLVFRLVR